MRPSSFLFLARATQAATNGARARAHLLIVAVAARSPSYRRVRLDLASVGEWLDRFAGPFLKRAQRAPHAATNRARVRAHLLMIAVAAQHVSFRVHIFRLTYMCVCAVLYRSQGRPRTPLSAALGFSCRGLAAAGTEREHYWLKSTGGGCCKTNSEMVVAPPRPSPSSSTSGPATRGSGSDPPAPPVRHHEVGAHARRGLLVNRWVTTGQKF